MLTIHIKTGSNDFFCKVFAKYVKPKGNVMKNLKGILKILEECLSYTARDRNLDRDVCLLSSVS